MKKTCVFLLLLICSISTLFAQVIKKDLVVGGSISYGGGNSTSGSTYSNSNISPRIGYGVGNNSILYLNLTAAFIRNRNPANPDYNNSDNFGARISWRKLFPIVERFGLYCEPYTGFGWANTHQIVSPGTSNFSYRSTNFYLGINPGIYFLVTPAFIINANFGAVDYVHSTIKNPDNSSGTNSSFEVNLLNYIGVGFDFVIRSHKSKI